MNGNGQLKLFTLLLYFNLGLNNLFYQWAMVVREHSTHMQVLGGMQSLGASFIRDPYNSCFKVLFYYFNWFESWQ